MVRKSDIRKAKELLSVTSKIERVYIRKLIRLRKQAINKVLKLYEQTGNEDVLNFLDEPYLKDFFVKMYTVTAQKIGVITVQQLGVKSSIKKQSWYKNVMSWIDDNTGEKITTVHNTMLDDIKVVMKNQVTIAQTEGYGISKIVDNVRAQMFSSLDWKVRRIVQTEVLSAASVAQNESVQSVGIPFEKTWVAAMINTRHTHKAMHGVTVDGSQMFLLPDGSQMEYPRDWRFGAPAGEIVNCQCMVVHRAKRNY